MDQLFDLFNAEAEADVTAPITAEGVLQLVLARTAEVPLGEPQSRPRRRVGKEIFDFCFALSMVIAVLPSLVFIALAIKLTSRGPVFYRAERIGQDGKPFRMFKFRTMYADADLDILTARSIKKNTLMFKLSADPRITPVGRFLRKYALDELPQFLNVLRGEMSIVGPRPRQTRDVVNRRVLLVKPGITGLWQLSGRDHISMEDALRLDLSYVENWSLALDLQLLTKTIGAVVLHNPT
ncbi:sugar transferase [Nocardia sp. NPDC058518]|uniref:sugar transferase n=1 Tax=Nocardia sp. NPDC058518 TaxID=3346534 RepID=UPI0036632CD6